MNNDELKLQYDQWLNGTKKYPRNYAINQLRKEFVSKVENKEAIPEELLNFISEQIKQLPDEKFSSKKYRSNERLGIAIDYRIAMNQRAIDKKSGYKPPKDVRVETEVAKTLHTSSTVVKDCGKEFHNILDLIDPVRKMLEHPSDTQIDTAITTCLKHPE